MGNSVLNLKGGEVVAVIAGMVALLILLVVAWPLLLIWSVNTLFGLGIAYTFWTWLAAFVLFWFISGQAVIQRMREKR